MARPAVVLNRRLRILAFVVGVGSTAAAAAPVATAPPTGLPAGKAKGTLTVEGKPVTLVYAYAELEANAFDAAKDDIVILLTEQPLPEEVLKRRALSRAADAAGFKNYLQVLFGESRINRDFAFLGAWAVANRKIVHEALTSHLITSPDFNAKVAPVAVGTDRVEATLYTNGPQISLDHKYEFRVGFHATVRPRFKKP